MPMKLFGPNFQAELTAAQCPAVQLGGDGTIETHVQTGDIYYRVKITCEVGQSAVDVRTAEIVGTYPCVTELQIVAIKAVLTAHNPATALADAAKQVHAEACYDTNKMIKALAFLVLDEINLIRGSSAATIAAMSDRTEDQLRTAWINKYKALL